MAATLDPAAVAQKKLEIAQEKAEFLKQLQPFVDKFQERLQNLPNESVQMVPLIGKQLYRHQMANYLEAAFFFQKSGDPVLDQKLINAFIIRDYEFGFGIQSGLLFSGLFTLLPAWKGYNIRTRLFFSSLPLLMSLYRGFRRGTDQVMYVGNTFIEHQLRKRQLLKHLRDNDNHLIEFKQHLLQRGDFNKLLAQHGLRELTKV